MSFVRKIASGVTGGIIAPVAAAVADVKKAREATRQAEIRRDQAELDAHSKQREREAISDGLKGLWRPLALLMLAALIAWYFAQTFVMFGFMFWDSRYGSGIQVSEDERYLIGQWVAAGTSLTLLFGGLAGILGYGRTREKIAGVASSSVINAATDKILRRRDPKPPAVTQEPLEPYDGPLRRMDGIVVPGVGLSSDHSSARPVVAPSGINLPLLEQEIKQEEGYRDHIYLDSLGHPTFGYGSLVHAGDPEQGLPVGTPISEQRIDEAFRMDLQNAIRDARTVVRGFDDLPQPAQHTLISMAFQLGGAGLAKFKNMLAAIASGDWNLAADEALNSLAAQQTPYRWKRNANVFRALAKARHA
jgi:lysozyme